MTDDNSPDNLRKFLESDDPATVMMGLEMAKGVGVEPSMFPKLLAVVLAHSRKNEAVSAAAEALLLEHLPSDFIALQNDFFHRSLLYDFLKFQMFCYPKTMHLRRLHKMNFKDRRGHQTKVRHLV